MWSFELTTYRSQVYFILKLPLTQPDLLESLHIALFHKNVEVTEEWKIKEETRESLLRKPYPNMDQLK